MDDSCNFSLFCWHGKRSVGAHPQPLSRASGRKRYNTLDFASKVVRQKGLAAPFGYPCFSP